MNLPREVVLEALLDNADERDVSALQLVFEVPTRDRHTNHEIRLRTSRALGALTARKSRELYSRSTLRDRRRARTVGPVQKLLNA